MQRKPCKPTPWKPFFVVFGCITTALGILGIFVPGLPTTPLILLSSWLFYRSSRRLHDQLHQSFLGKYIREYEQNRGISIKTKVGSILMMTAMVTLSITLFIDSPTVRWIVAIAGGIGFVVVAFVVPTRKGQTTDNKTSEN